ncbi:hypothetical protein WDZ17_04380 [Pseudokineococcus basanitobsidens]|uniref:DUF2382 domain-containing protein n=1 Tax=Pseudokineococcus basanitobsidens TaxID=1926649 RepID=A0ABU8RHH2_9ACTN
MRQAPAASWDRATQARSTRYAASPGEDRSRTTTSRRGTTDQTLVGGELVPDEVDLDAVRQHVPVVRRVDASVVLKVGDHQVATEQVVHDQDRRAALAS